MSKTSVFFKTENSNFYMYNRKNKMTHIVHPILKMMSEGNSKNYEIDNNNREYYDRKFSFFKKHHLIDSYSPKISPELNFNAFEKEIANSSQIIFEVTDLCNLACDYCAYRDLYNDYEERTNKNLSFNATKKIIDYFFEKWNSNLNYSVDSIKNISFYGGEPLLNFPLIEKVVDYIDKLETSEFKIVYNITTNGLLMEKHMDFFINNNFQTAISLDGDKESNSYRRSHDSRESYPKLYKIIKNIQTKYPVYFNENITFQTVLHNRNSVKDVTEYFDTEFSKKTEIMEINSDGIANDKIDKFETMYKSVSDDLHNNPDKNNIESDASIELSSILDYVTYKRYYTHNFFMDLNDLYYKKSIRTLTGTCKPFGRKVFVLASGTLLPCESIAHNNPHGSVGDEINIDSRYIFNKYSDIYNGIFNTCKTCWNSEHCD